MTAERDDPHHRTALINATIAALELITARDLMERFHAMMRSKDVTLLGPWIASAKESKLAGLAAGIEAD